jgi:hypothetical protein
MSEEQTKAKTVEQLDEEQPAEQQAGEELSDDDVEGISGGGFARNPEIDDNNLGCAACDCGLEDCDCIKCDSLAHTHA